MKRLALALALFATPALADSSLPPAKYDIGGETEIDTLAMFDKLFDDAVLIRVPPDQVMPECNALQMERYGTPYPAIEGTQLLGCMIRNWDYSDAVIVYVADPERPWLANRILRHEIGHLLGWPGTHTRR